MNLQAKVVKISSLQVFHIPLLQLFQYRISHGEVPARPKCVSMLKTKKSLCGPQNPFGMRRIRSPATSPFPAFPATRSPRNGRSHWNQTQQAPKSLPRSFYPNEHLKLLPIFVLLYNYKLCCFSINGSLSISCLIIYCLMFVIFYLSSYALNLNI
jgi:hypothetical protein